MERDQSNVVDIRVFLERRQRERLPLFDAEARPALMAHEPVRALSARELEHRERMLRHLTRA